MPTDVAEVCVDKEKQELQVFSKLTSCSAVPSAIHIVGAVVVIFIRNEDKISDEDGADAGSSARQCQSASPAEPGGTKCIPASLSVLPAPDHLPRLSPLQGEGRVTVDLHCSGRPRQEGSVSSPVIVQEGPSGHTKQNRNGSLEQNKAEMVAENMENSELFSFQQQTGVQLGMSTDVTAPSQTSNMGEASSGSPDLLGDQEEDTTPNLEIVKLEPLSPEPMDVADTESHQNLPFEAGTHEGNSSGAMILQIKEDHSDSREDNFEVVTQVNVEDSRNCDYRLGGGAESSGLDRVSDRMLSTAPDQMGGRAVARRGRCARRIRTGTPFLPRSAILDRPRLPHQTCTICQSAIQSYAEMLHHISEHRHLSPRPLCPVCYESFQDEVSLRRHAASHFPKPASLRCPLCQIQHCHVNGLRKHFQTFHPGQQMALKHFLHRQALRSRARLPVRSPRLSPWLPGPSVALPANATVTIETEANALQNKSAVERTSTAASTEVPSCRELPDGGREVSSKGNSCAAARGLGCSNRLDQDSRVWEREAENPQQSCRQSPSNTAQEGSLGTEIIDLESGSEDENSQRGDMMFPNMYGLSVQSSQPGSQGTVQDADDRDGKVHGTCRRTIMNGKEQELYVCSYCSQPFTRYGNFRRHLKTKHPQALGYSAEEADKKFTCPVCLHDYNRSDNLKYHVRKKHPDSYDAVFNSLSMNAAQEMPESGSSDFLRSQPGMSSWPLVPWDSQSHASAQSQDRVVRRSQNNSILQDSLEPDREPREHETQTNQSWYYQVPPPLGESTETSFGQDMPVKKEDQASGPMSCSLLEAGAANHPQVASRESLCNDPTTAPFGLPLPAGPGMSDTLTGRYSDPVAVASSQPVFPTHDQGQSTDQMFSVRNEKANADLSVSLHQEQMAFSLGSGYQHSSNFSCGTARDASNVAEASPQGSSSSQVFKAHRGKPSGTENVGSKHREPSQCSVCKDAIDSREQFELHIRMHSLNVGDNVCPICMTSFSTFFNLLRHAARHLGTSSYTCPVCSNSINRLDNFKIHLKNHVDIPQEIQNELKRMGIDLPDNSSS